MTSDSADLSARLQRSLGTAYVIERELGSGGMSRVFLAREHALGRTVVIKVLPPELAHELSAERFAREIRLSSQLQHPNVVPVLTAGDADGIPYYTMPFVDGESLRERLARLPGGERLPVSAALDALRDVARALAYSHDRGVVHRDIKPENVLLTFDAAVVADFGVAKATAAARVQGSMHGETLTQGGMSPGTPAYMSPEQIAGDPGADHRSDIYSWGVLAYELLAGTHPFADRSSVQALVTAHLADLPRALGDAAPQVPARVSALVMRCLAKAPADRPRSAHELLEVFAAGATGPNRGRVGRGAVLFIVLIGAGAGAIWTSRVLASRRGMSQSLRAPGTSAHDLYLRGKVQVSSENREDNEAAIGTLRAAIAADPTLAAAHATLARAYSLKAFYFAADSERKLLDQDAEVEVEKALSLDPKSAEAHFARGLLLWTPGRRFPHEDAIRAYRQALTLDPTLDEAHHQIAVVYFHIGMLDEAEREITAALALNPSNTLARFRYGVIDMYRGQYEKAYGIFKSTPLDKNPSLWAFQAATALFRLGRRDEATALIDRYLRDFPKDEGGVGHSVRAMMLAKAGRRAEAETAIAQSLARGRTFGHFHHSAYNIGSAYALLGDQDEAIRWLQNAADDGFPCYPLFATDRQLDGLRRDPRFIAMLAGLEHDFDERRRP